jgi:DNA polymerase (family X)
MRVYKRLGISSVDELRQRLESGEIEKLFGARMAQHIRQGLTETHAMLLYRADDLSAAIEAFLLGPCAVNRAEVAGDLRRRVDVIEELVFVTETDNLPAAVARMQRYGGRTPWFRPQKPTLYFRFRPASCCGCGSPGSTTGDFTR